MNPSERNAARRPLDDAVFSVYDAPNAGPNSGPPAMADTHLNPIVQPAFVHGMPATCTPMCASPGSSGCRRRC